MVGLYDDKLNHLKKIGESAKPTHHVFPPLQRVEKKVKSDV